MLGIQEFNDLERIELKRSFEKLKEDSSLELLTLVNREMVEKYSKSLLEYLSEKLDVEVYELETVNPLSLEFKVNNKDQVNLNEITRMKSFSLAKLVAKSFPHVFSLSSEVELMKSKLNFYKKIFTKNERFEGIIRFLEKASEIKLKYYKAVYLLSFLRASELLKNFFTQIRQPLVIEIQPEFTVKFQLENILHIVGNRIIDEFLSELIFQGKYKREDEVKKKVPLKRKILHALFPREEIDTLGGIYIMHEVGGKKYYFDLETINSITEMRYKIKFEPPAL
jgi:hypothetical protein